MTQAEIEKAAEEFRVPADALPPRNKAAQDIMFAYMRGRKEGFLAGAEHARAKWIKCSERMPDEGQWVLVSVNREHGSEVEIDCTHIMDGGEIIWLVCQQSDRYPDVEFSDVTHWMPLPSAPEAERK